MERLCPLVDSSRDAIRDELTFGGILRAFLPALLHLLNWVPIFSIVRTAGIDIGYHAPVGTDIVRAAWPPKAGNG
jgi:hypothetical protein